MDRLDPARYTIAWIAPLPIEAQAALNALDHKHAGRFSLGRGDDYVFRGGDINGYNVVVATLPAGQEYGTGSAAALASQLKKFFPNLWFGLLVGVAAGLPNLTKKRDIRLGDVLVGLPVGEAAGIVAYELGKETRGGFQLLHCGRVLANTEQVVRSAIGSIMNDGEDGEAYIKSIFESLKDKKHSNGDFNDPGEEKDVLYDTVGDDGAEARVDRPKREKRTYVWYGTIGSGDKLVKNAAIRNELRERHDLIGLEMEAAGTMNRIPVGVIRGVCDYGDEHKNKDWQPYAAAMAASYAKALFRDFGPGEAVDAQAG
ncbi:nucleoside phosphorylase domain-containing protein [Plectosphaerella plurivora]|uniref:Nucleoside phosphorylase domain-containing protein n=1 Tax=Plectosphaerella plurivora TaxID=936078 RepID=A0A9P8VQ50_9PEZI|nr:nucleoside phosphorylase domain-containing protein [Plectosphaerella plurivora]